MPDFSPSNDNMVTMVETIGKTGIKKRVLTTGQGDKPSFTAKGKATFHFKTIQNAHDIKTRVVLDDSRTFGKPFELLMGKSFKLDCWEDCVKTMLVGEVAVFSCPVQCVIGYPAASKSLRDMYLGKKDKPTHTCGMNALEHGLGYPDLDKFQKDPGPLDFELELIKFEEFGSYQRELWQMDGTEMAAVVPKAHEEGNKLFKEKKYKEAMEKYANGIACLKHIQMKERPGTPDWCSLDEKQIPLLLNHAQCNLTLGYYQEVINNCTEVLEKIDGHNNLKALFKRGKAYAAQLDEKECRADFDLVVQLDPTLEKDVKRELRKLHNMQKERDAELSSHLKGMFVSKD